MKDTISWKMRCMNSGNRKEGHPLDEAARGTPANRVEEMIIFRLYSNQE